MRSVFWRVVSCGSGAGSVEFADVGQVASRADGAASPARDGPSISLDKVLRRSVDDNARDEESDEVWRGRDRSSRYGGVLGPRETESLP
jgi:hypothetical protein